MPSKNWGGARPGAGRKAIDISDKEKKRLIKAARESAKKTGKSVWDVLMFWIYNKDEPRVSVAAIKIYQDAVIARESHATIEQHHFPAPVLLPVQDDDPARPEVVQTVN